MLMITDPRDMNALLAFGGQRAFCLLLPGAHPELPEPYTVVVQRPLDIPVMMMNAQGQPVQPSISVRVSITRPVLEHIIEQLGLSGVINDPRHPFNAKHAPANEGNARSGGKSARNNTDESFDKNEGDEAGPTIELAGPRSYPESRLGNDDWGFDDDDFDDDDDDEPRPTVLAC